MRNIFIAVIVSITILFSSAVFAEDAGLEKLILKKSKFLSKKHKKAKEALVRAAGYKTIGKYLLLPDGAEKQNLKRKIDLLSLRTQSKFYVEEMCLIGADGAELSRIVGDKIALNSELSSDETGAVFFKGGFAEEDKQVYISPIYMSEDADKWVFSYTTPISIEGEKKAILHYEHGLRSYQDFLDDGINSNIYLLAINKDGYIVSDSRKVLSVVKENDSDSIEDYFKNYKTSVSEGLSKIIANISDNKIGSDTFTDDSGSHSVAYKKMEEGWTLVAVK